MFEEIIIIQWLLKRHIMLLGNQSTVCLWNQKYHMKQRNRFVIHNFLAMCVSALIKILSTYYNQQQCYQNKNRDALFFNKTMCAHIDINSIINPFTHDQPKRSLPHPDPASSPANRDGMPSHCVYHNGPPKSIDCLLILFINAGPYMLSIFFVINLQIGCIFCSQDID